MSTSPAVSTALLASVALLAITVFARAEETAMIEAKNLHALTVEVPASTARFYNEAAERAEGVLEGEHVHFPEEDRRYVMLAVPAEPLPKEKFLHEYSRLEVLVDGDRRIRLSDHPRLFSRSLDDPELIRGVPTFVPAALFPDDFIGNAHDFELLRDGVRIFGPIRWLVPDARTGPIVADVQGGPGKGEVTVKLERVDFRLMALVVYLDTDFRDPLLVEQILPDGSSKPIELRVVGVDMVGNQEIFQEAYVEGFAPGFARELDVRIRFGRSGSGFFGAVGQTYTTYDGNKIVRVP